MFNHYKFVNSTAIQYIAYDVPSHTLRIVFTSGTAYDYRQVPPTLYLKLTVAPSVGRSFRELVRDRYRSTRLTDRELAQFMTTIARREHTKASLR